MGLEICITWCKGFGKELRHCQLDQESPQCELQLVLLNLGAIGLVNIEFEHKSLNWNEIFIIKDYSNPLNQSLVLETEGY